MTTLNNMTEDLGSQGTTPESPFCMSDPKWQNLKIFLIALNIPLSITAFLGNILVITVLWKVRSAMSIHLPSKLLYGCLVFTDLCTGLITQPLLVSFVLSPKHSKRCLHLRIPYFLMSSTLSGISVLTLTAISVDRYLALLLGLRYRHMVTPTRIRTVLTVFTLYSVSGSMSWLYNPRVATAMIAVTLLLCLLTASFCYLRIYLTLRDHQIQLQKRVFQPRVQEFHMNISRYRRTVTSAVWVQFALLLCYLPFSTVIALRAVTDGSNSSHTSAINLAWYTTGVLFLSNSSINPLLYCWRIKEVRQGVKNIISQLCCF
ncbi:histamine H2 receptor-like [Stylophora pistillata]|uniref:histamine H2 receptor-like n=1 Tax=Stylophora pistillata TaxID=50429 RepID=UPI000C041E76|nr:histamine H2 receptor-like [Stylophora pistillata]